MRKLVIKTGLLAVLVLAVISTAVYATESDFGIEIGIGVISGTEKVGGALNFREGPSPEYAILTRIPEDTVVSVLEYGSDGQGWYKVVYENQIGYVSAPYVDYTAHVLYREIGMTASCTEDTIDRTYCTICGYEYIHKVTPAPGHDFMVTYMSSSGGQYDCSEGGIKQSHCTRDLCGYVEYEPFSGHVLAFETSFSSDCEEESYSGYYCTLCDWEDFTVTPAPGHDLISVYTGLLPESSFNCESGGYKQTWCRRELCTYMVTEEIPPGHVFTEVSYIKPTYHSTGTQTMQCDYCGHRDFITIPTLIDDGMSEDVFAMGQAFMSGTWKLFGIYVPGFGFTFGGMLIGIALVSLSLSVIYMLFGFGRRGGAVSARSGSTNKAKISKERENDDH